MGMFDDIDCDYPLPDGFDGRSAGFQTKSLERMLDQYRITKDGELEIKKWDLQPNGKWYKFEGGMGREYVAIPEHPWTEEESEWASEMLFDNLGKKYNDLDEETKDLVKAVLDGPHEEQERVNERWEKVDYTGEVEFYDSAKDEIHEYIALFRCGRLVSIETTDRLKRYRK